ncbi:tRNA (adenosine(37)-N6)-dimethylallyltransferase MiaA [Caproiciproducens sp. NJN-50]|uniref:tRNA (adenosine(37)-N6)-dimethylallyltransferase MiaA n=1 Tax=Acutalibacteraceae TaxID=3082771 RepID=UPI000FFE1564|nr:MULTISPECIES: tRNA (adenosine(37)-N6)-dimethylallyltransferase MiaA [Acutalibacteraceae]QAT49847.1 tRNA (adenosine(37)-N6)-dimethylallyltransferase MiaA [Caproiciproducens sp. NJN-50]
MERIPVAAVVGPTATGKSRLAVELALRFHGEVVSADSMQIYRGLPIGTAQPAKEERKGVPHHLIGFHDPEKPFSVADYVALASECIRGIRERGRLPVLAGGTGLYVGSLLRHLSFSPEGRNEALRAELLRRAGKEGPKVLWEELRSFDPQSAERIHPNNVGRLVRSIEIYRETGITMTEQMERSRREPSPYDACLIGLDYRDRCKLYRAIDLRVDKMMETGLLPEAEMVLNLPEGTTARQAIGYKEFLPYFEGKCGLTEAVEQVKRESRRYAKRQRTWFRRQEQAEWIEIDEEPDFLSVSQKAEEILCRKGWNRS